MKIYHYSSFPISRSEMDSFRYFFDSFSQSYRMVMIAITFYDTAVFMIFMDHSLMNRGGSCMSLQSRGGKVQMQLKKKIRGLTIIAIVAMLMSLLVACAGNSAKGSSDNAQTGSNVSSNNQSSQAGETRNRSPFVSHGGVQMFATKRHLMRSLLIWSLIRM